MKTSIASIPSNIISMSSRNVDNRSCEIFLSESAHVTHTRVRKRQDVVKVAWAKFIRIAVDFQPSPSSSNAQILYIESPTVKLPSTTTASSSGTVRIGPDDSFTHSGSLCCTTNTSHNRKNNSSSTSTHSSSMWSKFSNALKSKSDIDTAVNSVAYPTSAGDLPTSSYTDFPVPIPQPSPPSSPSKNGRLGIFKRSMRQSRPVTPEGIIPLKLPLQLGQLPKKVKSSLNLNTSDLPRHSTDSLSTNTGTPLTAEFPTSTTSAHPPYSNHSQLQLPPLTPLFENSPHNSRSTGSVRSILRGQTQSQSQNPKTPATGQSVRFFSRDAYKVISPDPSMSGSRSEPSDPPLLQRLQHATGEVESEAEETKWHSAIASPAVGFERNTLPRSKTPQNLQLSPLNIPPAQGPGESSLMLPMPPANLSSLFDVSAIPAIPVDEKGLFLQDDAVEVREDEFSELEAQNKARRGDAPEREPPLPALPLSSTSSGAFKSSPASNGNNGSRQWETKSLGRRAGEAISQSFLGKSKSSPTSAGSDDAVVGPPRSSSSLGLYRMFGGSNDEPGKAATEDNNASNVNTIRNRAMSDTVFHRPTFSFDSASNGGGKVPEKDIDDTSAENIIVYGRADADVEVEKKPDGSTNVNGALEPPDPFRANATTYYTPETRISNSPPRASPYNSPYGLTRSNTNGNTYAHHAKSDSAATSKYSFSASSSLSSSGSASMSVSSEEVVMELRTQLALQQELSIQYEVDLNARDSLVENLTARLSTYEKTDSERRKVLKSWKKKVAELEKAYRMLEDEVEKSRVESQERSMRESIYGEASGEALRALHGRIGELEREVKDGAKREESLREERVKLLGVVQGLEEKVERMIRRDVSTEQESRESEEGRANLPEEMKTLQNAKEEVDKQLEAARRELEVCKAELEAQWRHAEDAADKIRAIESERDEYSAKVGELEDERVKSMERVDEMEEGWAEMEAKRIELEAEVEEGWEIRTALERERDELLNNLTYERSLIAQLKTELEEKSNQLTMVNEEEKFSKDNSSRLEAIIRQRDRELDEYGEKMHEQREEIDELRFELSQVKRENEKAREEAQRSLAELSQREYDATKRMEDAVRQQAESDAMLGTVKDAEAMLKEDNEKLRKRLYDLQKIDADREFTVTKLEKEKEKLVETVAGLNVALESKQQELELMKRKDGLKGTAGATPAAASRSTVSASRRQSLATPVPQRPASALSDIGKEIAHVENMKTATTLLGRSTRVNAGLNSSTSTAPPSAMKGKFVEGSMGPPLSSSTSVSRPRSSLAGNTTINSSGTMTPQTAKRLSSVGLARSTSARPSIGTPSTLKAHRQASSVSLRSSTSEVESGSVASEKENAPVKPAFRSAATTTAKAARRVSIVPSS